MLSIDSNDKSSDCNRNSMPKVMVVDDDKDATLLFEEVLRAEGYEPIILNESLNALQIANEEKPNLFILDLMMPEPDGFKLSRLLRKEPEFKRTPIIIVTALNDTDSRVVAISAGANDYLTKPFRLGELYWSLEYFLGKKSSSMLTKEPTLSRLKAPKFIQNAQQLMAFQKFTRIVQQITSGRIGDGILWFFLLVLTIAFFVLIKILS